MTVCGLGNYDGLRQARTACEGSGGMAANCTVSGSAGIAGDVVPESLAGSAGTDSGSSGATAAS